VRRREGRAVHKKEREEANGRTDKRELLSSPLLLFLLPPLTPSLPMDSTGCSTSFRISTHHWLRLVKLATSITEVYPPARGSCQSLTYSPEAIWVLTTDSESNPGRLKNIPVSVTY
jgi:hypothetical protein